MIVETYQLHHKSQLINWLQQWNISTSCIDHLPNTGLIIQDKCAIFLYETNSDTAFIEGFICNKSIVNEERKIALDLISESIIELAKSKGYKRITGSTIVPEVIQRVQEFGCKVLKKPYYVYEKDL